MAAIGDAKGEYRGLIYRNDADLKAWLAKRPTEAPLEPDLPIIDPHHHFWDAPHRGQYFLPDLLADIGGHNLPEAAATISSPRYSSNARRCTAKPAPPRWRRSAKSSSSTASPP